MIFNMTEAEWDAVIAVHLKGTFNCTRAASIQMREQQGGRIVSMSSVSALGSPGQPNYAAAKAGIMGLTWSTANALGKYGVTANAIMPSGATRMIDSTPRGKEVFEETGKWPSEMAKGTERDPDNVAPLVVYLASDAAANVNGQVFHSYGYGYTLLEQPHAVRSIRAQQRWDPEELAQSLSDDARREPEAAAGRRLRHHAGRAPRLKNGPAWTMSGSGTRPSKSRHNRRMTQAPVRRYQTKRALDRHVRPGAGERPRSAPDRRRTGPERLPWRGDHPGRDCSCPASRRAASS